MIGDIDSIEIDMEAIASINTQTPYSNWKIDNARLLALFEDTKEKSVRKNKLLSSLLSRFEKEIFNIDYNGIYYRFKTKYTSFWKVFKKKLQKR